MKSMLWMCTFVVIKVKVKVNEYEMYMWLIGQSR